MLFDPHTEAIHRLDPPAALIWSVLSDANHDLDSIVDAIAEVTDVPPEELERDVVGTLEALADAGVVELHAAESPRP